MSKGAIIAIVIWIILIAFPEIIAYILGLVFISIWASVLLAKFVWPWASWSKTKDNDYFKFWEYKIYKNGK